MDQAYIFDELGKTDMLPIFSGTMGEMINVIEDHMSSAADMTGSKDFSMACEVLKKGDTACLHIRNFMNMKSIADTAIVIGLGNIFAKKIDLRDNFLSFDEFLNNYRDFVYIMEVFLTKLIPLKRFAF